MLDELIKHRRFFHKNAECGFYTPLATQYILNTLESYGVKGERCGKSGVIADIGKNMNGKRFLLRADFDALEMEEKTGLDFASKDGKMHACGHDMHAAMLLGAAKLLKECEPSGLVRLMFEPAEEILCGAKDMIENGVLDGGFGGAMMLHVISGSSLPNGKVIIPSDMVCAPSADFFEITVSGKSCHGAMSEKGVSALSAGAQIVNALGLIKASELGMSERAALSVGCFQSGKNANVIPDCAVIKGTMRVFGSKTREFMKKRITGIVDAQAEVFGATAKTVFTSGCPEFINSGEIAQYVLKAAREVFGEDNVIANAQGGGSSGSEDFAYISQKVPSVMTIITAGNNYPQHHPKVDFDENVLLSGAKLLTKTAILYAK